MLAEGAVLVDNAILLKSGFDVKAGKGHGQEFLPCPVTPFFTVANFSPEVSSRSWPFQP